jgi:hypothetical protein
MGTRIPGAADLLAGVGGQEGTIRLVRQGESHVASRVMPAGLPAMRLHETGSWLPSAGMTA